MKKNSSKGFRLSLKARIFLATSLLLVVALAAIVIPTIQVGKEVANRSVDEAINNSLSLQNYFRGLNERELLIVLDGFASDPTFSAYVAEAIGTGEDGERDLYSVQDLILSRKEESALDFVMLLDPQGKVLVHSDNPLQTGKDLSQTQLIQPVVEELVESTGIWLDQDQMYQAAVMPISLDYELVGFVVAGLAITEQLAAEMKQVGGGNTLFIIAQDKKITPVASTFNREESSSLIQQLESQILTQINNNNFKEKISFNFNQQNWSVKLVPLAQKEKGKTPLFLSFSSESKYTEGYDKIFDIILWVAVITIAISIFISILVMAGILTPIKQLANAALSAAKGNYNTSIGIKGNDELAVLSNAIESLLGDLRDKDDMQSYISELSKILPEETPNSPKFDANPKVSVDFNFYALLAIDVNSLLEDGADPNQAINRLQKLNDIIVGQIEVAKGELFRLGNGIYIAAFAKKYKEQHAYSAAGGVDKAFIEQGLVSQNKGAKYSLSIGQCYTGNIVANYAWQKVILGTPVRLAVQLLADSPTNSILATNSIYKLLKQPLHNVHAQVEAITGKISGKKLCRLDLDSAHQFVMPLTPEQTIARGNSTHYQAKRQSVFELRAGSVFAERYEIITSLGKGSIGLVFKAMDKELKIPVALKILRKEIADDEEHIESLRSEIILARRVTHPNILRTYDLGKEGETLFLSMEYVRGMTLSYLIQQSGRLPFSAALRVAKQLCEGLISVHQIGILHRDIKSENVILEPNGNLKLMDFGIAKTLSRVDSDIDEPKLFMGTPSYASPEQIQSSKLTEASDIYSLGILLTEIFTGKLPIKGSSIDKIFVAHLTEDPIKPTKLWPEMPPELEIIILKCLRKTPKNRYGSVEALLKDIEKISV